MQDYANFEEDISKLEAYGATKVTKRETSYNTGDYPDGLILSHNAALSHIHPEMIKVSNVQELKQLCGVPDHIASANLTDKTLIPPHKKEVTEDIVNPIHPHICNALNEFVFGNSSNVESWESDVNKMRFPMQVAVFSAQNITVHAGKPLQLKGTDAKPIALVADKITLEAGGQIITQGPGKVSSQVTVSNDPVDPSSVTLLSIGGDGGDGGKGGDGSDAGVGSDGGNATEDGKSGCNPAGAGGKGGDGTDATKGGDGGDGGIGGIINFSFPIMNGNFTVGSIGGNGGNGANGGRGGNAGAGGAGGTSCRSCGVGAQGPGGNGGKAGDGGLAGNGGNGQKVYINYNSGSPTFKLSSQKANGGNGGDAGVPGKLGNGVPPGKGGGSGASQSGGKGGTPGQVIINGNALSS